MNLTMNSRTPDETTCVLDIEGEVDVYTSPQLKQDLVQLAERGVKRIIINLSKVDYLDSTGLGVLIGGLKRLREADGNLVLVGPGMRIQRIFEITGLNKIFDIYDTEEEAACQRRGGSVTQSQRRNCLSHDPLPRGICRSRPPRRSRHRQPDAFFL